MTDASKAWIAEKDIPGYSSAGFLTDLAAFGHATQVLWKQTTKVGCAAVPGPNCVLVSCRYVVPGNNLGQQTAY